MTTSTEDLGERVSRLEGGYEHLATKADLADVKSELKADIAEANAKIDRLTVEMARSETRLLLRFGSIAVAAVAAAVGFSQLLG